MRHALVLALASTLLLTGCGSDDQAAPPLVDAPSAGAAPMPDASAVEAYDLASACDLLSVADVETAADGLGWGVVVEEPARCVYQDPDATHSVTLTLTSLAAYEAFDGIGVGAGASGMRALDTGEGRAQVWAPAGATAAVVVSQEPALLSADALVALTESAALALENAPLAGAGGASDSASAAPLTAGLLRVRLDGTIPSTGKSIEIDVSAARVAEAAAPGITTIACVGGSGDTGPGRLVRGARDGRRYRRRAATRATGGGRGVQGPR